MEGDSPPMSGAPGQLTECGTYRWCADCGNVKVAKVHEDQRCWKCSRILSSLTPELRG